MAEARKKYIQIPESVKVQINNGLVTVGGPKGELAFQVRPEIKVVLEDKTISLEPRSTSRMARNLFGTTRTVISNMIVGVTEGWSKQLEISGTGFRANVSEGNLTLSLGFSHPVVIVTEENITFGVKDNIISVSGIDKARVGELAAQIRKVRPADPYKARGLKYINEIIRRKAGKAVKAAGS